MNARSVWVGALWRLHHRNNSSFRFDDSRAIVSEVKFKWVYTSGFKLSCLFLEILVSSVEQERLCLVCVFSGKYIFNKNFSFTTKEKLINHQRMFEWRLLR